MYNIPVTFSFFSEQYDVQSLNCGLLVLLQEEVADALASGRSMAVAGRSKWPEYFQYSFIFFDALTSSWLEQTLDMLF